MAENLNQDLNWKEAENHFRSTLKIYKDMEGMSGVNTSITIQFILNPILERFESGERSLDLYDDMMSVE